MSAAIPTTIAPFEMVFCGKNKQSIFGIVGRQGSIGRLEGQDTIPTETIVVLRGDKLSFCRGHFYRITIALGNIARFTFKHVGAMRTFFFFVLQHFIGC